LGVQDAGPARISKLQKKKLFKKFEKEKHKPSQACEGAEESRTSRKRRIKFCPRCGSINLFWASGLPQLWSIWECKHCGYRGALVLEDSILAEKLREDYAKKATK
jgi:predicted RNA-binding Zn-ribbon protein involved in translation (DUF1610 family)